MALNSIWSKIILNYAKKIVGGMWVESKIPVDLLPPKDELEIVIDLILKQDFGLLIRETFPDYKGKIHQKTSAPHKLIIKVMIIMLKLKRQDITWSTVKEFIEEHISQNYNRATLVNLEDINDDNFTVSGYVLDKINATKKVGDYKRAFKI